MCSSDLAAVPFYNQTKAIQLLDQIADMDDIQRGIENLDADAYEKLGYYERWIVVIRHILLEKNLFTVDELEAKIREIASRFEMIL